MNANRDACPLAGSFRILRGGGRTTLTGSFGREWSLEEASRRMRGEGPALRGLELRWFTGKRVPGDFCWSSLLFGPIVSERVVERLVSRGMTGFETAKCAVVDKAGKVHRGYHALIIKGRCGELVGSSPCVGGRGGGVCPLWFVPESWDGSDVFCPPAESGAVFVSARCKEILVELKASGVWIEPVCRVGEVDP